MILRFFSRFDHVIFLNHSLDFANPETATAKTGLLKIAIVRIRNGNHCINFLDRWKFSQTNLSRTLRWYLQNFKNSQTFYGTSNIVNQLPTNPSWKFSLAVRLARRRSLVQIPLKGEKLCFNLSKYSKLFRWNV